MTDTPSSSQRTEPSEIDASVPNSARIWNYWLGGKDHYPVDRRAGDAYRAIYPEIVDVARASRQFLNTHDVAQRVTPDTRVVYVDNDPVVLAHARALLTSTRAVTAYVDADLRDPDTILAAAARTLDFTRPIGLMLLGILGHVDDDDEARSIVRRLLGALPAGSYLTICDGTNDLFEAGVEAQRRYNESGAMPYRLRSARQIAEFFEGTEPVEPGVVSCPLWRPDPVEVRRRLPAEMDQVAGMGRKPEHV